jgi:hypothetical protein
MTRSTCSMIRALLSLVCLALLIAVTAGVACATVVTENFNSDPGWQAAGNTNNYNEFGYSDSNHAGGSTHEAGGAIASRTNGFDWYADNTLPDGAYTLKDSLTASGKFTVQSVDGFNGGFEVGFFNPEGTGTKFSGGIGEAIMMRIIDGTSSTVRTNLRMAGNDASPVSLDVGTAYTFNLEWNPTALNPDLGRATLTIKTAGGADVATLSVDHDNDGWSLSDFGLTTLNFGTYYNNGASFYMDDLAYGRAVPEPGSLSVVCGGLLGMLAYAWRKRR